MIVLDTDHVTELLKGTSPTAVALRGKIDAYDDEVATTIVSIEEVMRGWMAELRRQTSVSKQIRAYERLQGLFSFFASVVVLPFDDAAGRHFEMLRGQKLKVGTMDLKIASICRSVGATLLTRNAVDFERVPELKVENWLD
jgi:tRNA(fMet)-specific endonuclease VapC